MRAAAGDDDYRETAYAKNQPLPPSAFWCVTQWRKQQPKPLFTRGFVIQQMPMKISCRASGGPERLLCKNISVSSHFYCLCKTYWSCWLKLAIISCFYKSLSWLYWISFLCSHVQMKWIRFLHWSFVHMEQMFLNKSLNNWRINIWLFASSRTIIYSAHGKRHNDILWPKMRSQ